MMGIALLFGGDVVDTWFFDIVALKSKVLLLPDPGGEGLPEPIQLYIGKYELFP
jgi:hypothetical protein